MGFNSGFKGLIRCRSETWPSVLETVFCLSSSFARCGIKRWKSRRMADRDMNSLLTYVLPSYLLTPWNRVHSEKLTGSQLVKKFPVSYGTRRFIAAFTSTRHLSLSWARSIQSMLPTSNFLKIYLNIVLPSMPLSSSWSLSLRFPHQNPVYTSRVPLTRETCPAHLILLDVRYKNIG